MARVKAVVAQVTSATARTTAPSRQGSLGMAQALETGFRAAAADAIAQAHHAKVAVPLAGEDDALVWLHPDGTLRPTPD